jgi:hypothetical protein
MFRRCLVLRHPILTIQGLAFVLATLVLAPPPAAIAQTANNTDLRQTLSDRLLGVPQSAQLYPGQFPPNLPLDVPLPPNSTLIGSEEQSFAGTVPTTQVIVLDDPESPNDSLSFYARALPAIGWTPPPTNVNVPPGITGFLPGPPSSPASNNLSATYCSSQTGPWLSITAFPEAAADGTTMSDVRLRVTQRVSQLNSFGPCSAPATVPGPVVQSPGADLLPQLAEPPGVQVHPGASATNGSGGYSSTATAVTDESAADLHDFFSVQLEAAGWTQTAGGADGPLAWSTWSVPGGGNWSGYLLVLESASPNTRSLWVGVQSASPAGSAVQPMTPPPVSTPAVP